MPPRRVLSIWFPRLAAERILRHRYVDGPFVVVSQSNNALSLTSVCAQAQAQGLSVGQSLSDARVLCPNLTSQIAQPIEEEVFLSRLLRWAGKFSPWVAAHPPASLLIDISGCAHLFGGEENLAEIIRTDCEKLRLSVQLGIADTVGGAWALARYSGAAYAQHRTGDAIEQEARATRSRAAKRRNWERGGTAPTQPLSATASNIAPPGQTVESIKKLPLAALRLPADVCAKLNRVGLRSVGDLGAIPRRAVARRFGLETLRRLDQAFGFEPEPVCPSDPPQVFAARLSFPDPIGLEEDIKSGLSRLLGPWCAKLRRAGRGARAVRLSLMRTDQTVQLVEVRLAQPSHDPARVEPLIHMRLPTVDPGFGIDTMRLEAMVTEPIQAQQHRGPMAALAQAKERRDAGADHADLLGRLGARIGLDALVLLHPADSNIPEKTSTYMAAAYASPAPEWPHAPIARPITIFAPEPVLPADDHRPPSAFRWRRRDMKTTHATGPERITPEWWLDDPNWRTGTRDYWHIVTNNGARLWLFQAFGGSITGGWFCHGDFG